MRNYSNIHLLLIASGLLLCSFVARADQPKLSLIVGDCSETTAAGVRRPLPDLRDALRDYLARFKSDQYLLISDSDVLLQLADISRGTEAADALASQPANRRWIAVAEQVHADAVVACQVVNSMAGGKQHGTVCVRIVSLIAQADLASSTIESANGRDLVSINAAMRRALKKCITAPIVRGQIIARPDDRAKEKVIVANIGWRDHFTAGAKFVILRHDGGEFRRSGVAKAFRVFPHDSEMEIISESGPIAAGDLIMGIYTYRKPDPTQGDGPHNK